jgi:acetylornithine deacetylase/succinyl-diaminopimelate desuccinylase-like protein
MTARAAAALSAGLVGALALRLSAGAPAPATAAGPPGVAAGAAAAAPASAAADALARAILEQLIAINTTDSAGNVTTASEAMAQRLLAAGFPATDVVVAGPNDRKKNLVVRLRGPGKHRPVLLLGHLDVVEAARADWSTDPFTLVERGGYFYGRGTLDMKGPDAIMVTTLIRLKQAGFQPARDVILALTADEEVGCCNGVAWLLQHRHSLIDAEFALNADDYSVILERGRPLYFRIDASEKVYADFELTVVSPGGHSSEPVPGNAIYTLTHGLDRLAAFEFPFELNNVSREYFRRMADIESGQPAADMRAILRTPPDPQAISRLSADTVEYPVMRTTCVPTRFAAGHANNALPQRARAVVNCRILPGHSPREVQLTLSRVLADPAIDVRYIESDGRVRAIAPQERGYAPPPLLPAMLRPLEQVVGEMWPNLRVIPFMSPGASDAVYTSAAGIPTYTFAGVAVEASDDREHGRDERLGVASFYRGNEFFYRYLQALTAQ